MKYLVLLICVLTFLIGCNNRKKFQVTPLASSVIDQTPGTCPYLTKDNHGNVVLTWVRSMDDSSAVFCYAVSKDGGKSFGGAVVIPASNNVKPHSENIPKVIFKPSGEIIAIWGAASKNPNNKYAGAVYYAQSFDDGKSWTDAKMLVKDTAGNDQRYFDVALLSNGEVAITWLDNRKTNREEGSALYYASTVGGSGFQNEKLINQSCCQCCRTDLFVDHKNNIHVLYRAILNDSIRDMVHTVSFDGGNSFTAPQKISNDNWIINGCPHTGPAMMETNKGLHFAWYTGGEKKGSFYTRSVDSGKSFMTQDSISQTGMHPQLAASEAGDVLIVWDEAVQKGEQFYKRIGIQKRSAEGKNLGKTFVTVDSLNFTYPVISAIKEDASLIAYCEKRNDKTYVTYQLLRFE